MMGKIGFVNLSHKDYITDTVLSIADKAVKAMHSLGIEVYSIDKPVTDCLAAELAGRELVKNEVDGVVIFLGSWIECPVAMSLIREVEHLPLCMWGFPMFKNNGRLNSTGSYVSFAMLKGSLDRVKFKYKPVLGMPDDSETKRNIRSFCTAAVAAKRLKRMRIGLVGYTSMGIYPGTFDHLLLRVNIGPEVEQIDSYTMINIAENVDEQSCVPVIDSFKKYATINQDVRYEDLIKASKLYIAMKRLANERHLHCINVKCQYEFSKEYGMVPCVPLSLLAEDGIVASCEGDILNTVSMAILSLITGETVTYGDAIHHENDVVKLSACGFIPFSMGMDGKREIRRFLPHPGFKGIQNSFVMRPGKVTVMRLIEDIGSYHMLYFTGEGLETELRDGYMPAIDVRLDEQQIDSLVEKYAGQHYAICYGDVSTEIEDLARILGVKVVRV